MLRREGSQQERRLGQPDHQLRQRHERLRRAVPGIYNLSLSSLCLSICRYLHSLISHLCICLFVGIYTLSLISLSICMYVCILLCVCA
jgi:hypothetical protein